MGCLRRSEDASSQSNNKSDRAAHDQSSSSKFNTSDFIFSRPGMPFNSLLHIGIGFLGTENSKEGIFGDLDKRQIHSIEIEGISGTDRSVLDVKELDFNKIYKHRINRRDHQVMIKINFSNGSSSKRRLKAKHGDILWL